MKALTGDDQKTLMALWESCPQIITQAQRKMRVKQIWRWLYKHGLREISLMSNLPQTLRSFLAEHYVLRRCVFKEEHKARDGVIKWLMDVGYPQREHTVETVYIPEPATLSGREEAKAFRGTLCVSSQVGCVLDCGFCHTGTQPFIQNLPASAIVEQVLLAKDALDDWGRGQPSLSSRLVTNIVFMGMGEPLYNTENVLRAVSVLSADDGLCYGRRRITLSTAGIVPEIPKLAQAQSVSLAVSLHAPDNTTRSALMPINKRYPIEALLEVCQDYTHVTKRPVTFEYVLLEGINDSIDQAQNLVSLVAQINAKVNLIPFNPWPGSRYRLSKKATMGAFASVLHKSGIVAPIRRTRGADIMAACGQLKSPTQRPIKQAA